jgi:hypothetical protein
VPAERANITNDIRPRSATHPVTIISNACMWFSCLVVSMAHKKVAYPELARYEMTKPITTPRTVSKTDGMPR